MHSDDVARQYGFRAALVPGVTVYGYLCAPVVSRFGSRWLESGNAQVRFLSPAYDGEWLIVREAADARHDAGRLVVTCENESGRGLARLEAGTAECLQAADAAALLPAGPSPRVRPEATWDAMVAGTPLPTLAWQPAPADNAEWCRSGEADDAPYRDGPRPIVHPGLVLRQANAVLKNAFVLPAWIHVSSRIVHHAGVRTGDDCEVRAVPEDKWRRNGHDYARLHVAIVRDRAVVATIRHTVIFRPAAAPMAGSGPVSGNAGAPPDPGAEKG